MTAKATGAQWKDSLSKTKASTSKQAKADIKAQLAEAADEERGTAGGRVMLYLGAELHGQFRDFCRGHGLSMNKAAILAINNLMDEASE